MLSSAQGSLQVITLADGGPRPLTRADLLYVRSEPVPLFVQFLKAFFTFLPWLRQALSCRVLLLMKRLHLFVLRLFVTCEDYRLRSAPDIIFNALSEFTTESWQALLHLSTSPVPQVGRVDPQLVERGLGAVGNYTISDDLWCELAPPDFEASVSDFHLERESHSSNREALVRPMVKWLLREGIVTIMDEDCPLRATCWPFVIPKSTEKVSLWPTKTVRVLRATSSPAIDLKLYSPIAPQALVCALQNTPPGLRDTTTHVHTPAIQTREAALMQA